MRIGRVVLAAVAIAAVAGAAWFWRQAEAKHLGWPDFSVFWWQPPAAQPPVENEAQPQASDVVRFLGLSKYLNGAQAVVTHTIDDSTRYVPRAIEAMDKYGIKATIFVSTERRPIADLWPVLRRAVENGHEIGSHSRTHPCLWPPTLRFCFFSYSDWELAGSRDDILRETSQPHVWAFAYPCGLCSGHDFIHRKVERAGYLVARNYPNEAEGGHMVPNQQGWDTDLYNATYTQVVQKKGGIAPAGRTDVAEVNRKFDEVYKNGGIYNFLSHPQWLDYGPEGFYEQHLKYLGGRPDVWYVPMGPLYAYQREIERTRVKRLGSERFEVTDDLPAKQYPASVTLQFSASGDWAVEADGRPLPERGPGPTDRWDGEYYRTVGNSIILTIRPPVTLQFRKK